MSQGQERLILFTRYPVSGRTKTRLITALGAEGAAGLQRRLTLRVLRVAEALRSTRGVEFEIHFDGGSEAAMKHWLGDQYTFRQQGQGDLGKRIASAFEASFREGCQSAVIIGADCPGLTPELLSEAFTALRSVPVVLGPANDGGYYLIGLRHAVSQLFEGPVWGTNTVLSESLSILERVKLKSLLLVPLHDIDRREDLPVWYRLIAAEEADLTSVSVIIPALNEAENISAAVASAAQGCPREILVIDGGSLDATVQRAKVAGASVVISSPGRARQMNAGAARALGNVLLFLHADSLLPRDYASSISQGLQDAKVAAGAFRFAVAGAFRGRKLLERTTNLRSRWLQLPYGDQGLFLRKALFEELGGFAAMPILEDYELVRRLRRRGRVVTLPQAVATSGRRWQRAGVLRGTLTNQWVIGAYHLGWPLPKLAAMYRGSVNDNVMFHQGSIRKR